MGVRDEIAEQPEVARRLLRDGRAEAEAIAAALGHPAFLVVAARGSSDHAALYAQHLFGARRRLTVALAAPSLVTIYDTPPSLAGGAMLAISQSGQSPDIVAVLADARRQGVPAIAITNDPASPLAQAASSRLDLRAGPEHGIAATKTYTAELIALAMIAAGGEQDWRELSALPDAIAAALGEAVPAFDAERAIVLGRGYNYATARELALKLKEAAGVAAEAFSFADFEHGPIALVGADDVVIIVGPSGRVDAAPVLERIAARGARAVVLSDRAELLARAAVALPVPPGIPEWLSPIVCGVAGQRLAVAVADRRGVDPDAPRGLSKVTRTR